MVWLFKSPNYQAATKRIAHSCRAVVTRPYSLEWVAFGGVTAYKTQPGVDFLLCDEVKHHGCGKYTTPSTCLRSFGGDCKNSAELPVLPASNRKCKPKSNMDFLQFSLQTEWKKKQCGLASFRYNAVSEKCSYNPIMAILVY